MGIVFRQSVKSSIVIFAGALLGALIIYLQQLYFPKQEFGFIRNFTNQAVVMSQVTMLGMNIVLAIYIHKYPPGDARKPVLITLSLLIPVVITSLLSVFYFLLKPQIIHLFKPVDQPFVDHFYLWLPIFTLLWSVLLLLEHYLNSQLKIALSVLMREVVLRVFNIVVIVLFVAGYFSYNQFVIGSVLIYLFPIIFLWIVCKKTEGFGISFQWHLISRKEFNDIIHFAWYHTLMGISLNLLGYLDALMLAPLDKSGVSSIAEYSIAVFIITIMQIPYRSMATAALPDLTKSYEVGDMEKVNQFFKRAAINVLIVAVGMWLLIVLNMHNAVLILNKGYDSVTMLVVILSIGKLVDMATGLNNEMISVSKHYKFNFYISLVLVGLIFVFNRMLIPIYGVYGAAMGTTLALVIFNIAKLLFLWKKMKLQPFTTSSLLVLAAGISTGILCYFLPFFFHPIVDVCIRSAIIIVVFGLLLILLKPSQDLNHFLASVKKNKRLF